MEIIEADQDGRLEGGLLDHRLQILNQPEQELGRRMGVTQRTSIGQRCGSLEERVQERFEFGWTCHIRLDRPTTDAKSQGCCQFRRSIDELGLARPGAAFDHDGPSGSRSHLVKPTFDNGQLCLAASKGKRLLGHGTARNGYDSVVAMYAKKNPEAVMSARDCRGTHS
jgi:hypothetical protein